MKTRRMSTTVYKRAGTEVSAHLPLQCEETTLITPPALHFHLTVASGSDSYEDTEFIYQPLLNEQRDKDLLDLLPDYLTEEIYFPRGQAAKFYCKVVDSMSRKIILEEE